jgi:DNA-binding NarL/FixJ family response regulator
MAQLGVRKPRGNLRAVLTSFIGRRRELAAVRSTIDVGPEKDRTQLKGVVLGAREEEVCTLVAQGLSNKDIAARLFLSLRTVETHVHHLLNKLGVNSRTQIAVWFSEPR